MQTFSKPQAARQIEARARARRLGVRVAVVSHARSYISASQSTPGSTYRIERCRHGWSCECDGFLFTGWCKHLAAVERRAEREGWDFGQVAPLATLTEPGFILKPGNDRRAAHSAGQALNASTPAAISDFRPRFSEREASTATARANADLFGA